MTCYLFALIVEGLDPSDESQVLALDALPEVLLLSDTDGLVTVHLEIEAGSAAAAITDAIQRVEALPAEVHVVSVDLDLVAATDIAHRTGRSRQAVSQWAAGERAGRRFPAPLGRVAGGTRVWPWSVVLPWLRDHGHVDDGERAPSYEEIVVANASLLRRRLTLTDAR